MSAKCPYCNAPVVTPAKGAPRGNFPFCSERCRMIDLGAWAREEYRVASKPTDESEDSTKSEEQEQ